MFFWELELTFMKLFGFIARSIYQEKSGSKDVEVVSLDFLPPLCPSKHYFSKMFLSASKSWLYLSFLRPQK